MKVHGFEHLLCPLDQQPLLPNEQGWQCSAGHQFDRAKQGYVNLLPVQQKKSLQPGDNKDMVRARKSFLDTGYYGPVASALSNMVLTHINNSGAAEPAYLDAGCGEGYYLAEFIRHASEQPTEQPTVQRAQHSVALLGLDISKWAVQAAAKRSKQIQWVVGTNAQLPIANASFDVISAVFGFPVYEEFARVLKPNGLLIVVEPTANHLHQLRDIIYPTVAQTERPAPKAMPGFNLHGCQGVNFTIKLTSSNDILNLLAMTPHVHRITNEALSRLTQLTELTVTVDMQCVLYLRNTSNE